MSGPLGSWLRVEAFPDDPEFVEINLDLSHGIVNVEDEDGPAVVVDPHAESVLQPEQTLVASVEPSVESMKLTLKGRTVIFCGMTKEEQAKEFAEGFEGLIEPIVRDDKIFCWWLKAAKVPRLKELICYFRERAEKMSDKDAVDYAVDMEEWFAEPRSYLLDVNFLPKLVRLTKAPLFSCSHFEIIQCLSNYFHCVDLTYEDVFLASEDQHLLDPLPAPTVESSLPEAIIEFLETGQEPPFLLPGKEIFMELLTIFKPLKEKLLQICTVEKLSEYLNDVDRNSKTPCPFQLAPEIQLELNAFLALYIKHRFEPLYVEEEPLSLIELQIQRLQQLKENAFATLEKVVHAANLNITFDRLSNEVRLEKNEVLQDVSLPDSDDDDLVFIFHSDPDSPYS